MSKQAFKTGCVVCAQHRDVIYMTIGTIGIGATAVTAAIAANKAKETTDIIAVNKGADLTIGEKIKASWKYYIPTAALGLTTTALFITAGKIKDKRLALMTTAYKITEESYKNYKKAVEKVSSQEEKEKITKEFVNNQKKEVEKTMPQLPADLSTMPGDGNQIFYEPLTGRYFRCDSTRIKGIVNAMNKTLLAEGSVCYDVFEDLAKLPASEIGFRWQWLYDDTQKLVEIDMTSATTLTLPNGTIVPVIVVGWVNEPMFQDRY